VYKNRLLSFRDYIFFVSGLFRRRVTVRRDVTVESTAYVEVAGHM